MNKHKKIAALGISALMFSTIIAGSIVPVNAAVNKTDTAVIKATGLEDSTQGTIYKIIDVNWENGQPKAPQFSWASEVKAWVKSNYPNYIDKDGVSVSSEFKNTLGDKGEMTNKRTPADNGAAKFYDDLAAAIKKDEVTLKGEDFAAQSKVATIEGKQMGGYLLLFKNDMKVYRPSVVSVYPKASDNSDWTLDKEFDVIVKSSAVPVEKTVDLKNTDIGQKVNFKIDATLPVYPKGTVNKMYNIFDKLSDGLTLDESSIVVNGIAEGGQSTKLNEGDAYSKIISTAHADASFGLKMNYEKVKQYEKIEVKYSATLNRNAVIGEANTNKAIVDYNNNPYDSKSSENDNTPGKTTETPETKTYTYGFDVTKTDGSKKPLAGAAFSVKKKGGADVKLVKDSDGVYHVADGLNKAKLTTESVASSAEVDSKGKLLIKGLNLGEYELTEVKAPNGYVKLQAPIAVTIKDANNDGIADENASSTKGYVSIAVTNDKGFTWPTTGGQGTYMLAAGGSIVVAIGVMGVAASRKKGLNK